MLLQLAVVSSWLLQVCLYVDHGWRYIHCLLMLKGFIVYIVCFGWSHLVLFIINIKLILITYNQSNTGYKKYMILYYLPKLHIISSDQNKKLKITGDYVESVM